MLDYKVGSSLKNTVVKGAPSRTDGPAPGFITGLDRESLIAGSDPRSPVVSEEFVYLRYNHITCRKNTKLKI